MTSSSFVWVQYSDQIAFVFSIRNAK